LTSRIVLVSPPTGSCTKTLEKVFSNVILDAIIKTMPLSYSGASINCLCFCSIHCYPHLLYIIATFISILILLIVTLLWFVIIFVQLTIILTFCISSLSSSPFSSYSSSPSCDLPSFFICAPSTMCLHTCSSHTCSLHLLHHPDSPTSHDCTITTFSSLCSHSCLSLRVFGIYSWWLHIDHAHHWQSFFCLENTPTRKQLCHLLILIYSSIPSHNPISPFFSYHTHCGLLQPIHHPCALHPDLFHQRFLLLLPLLFLLSSLPLLLCFLMTSSFL